MPRSLAPEWINSVRRLWGTLALVFCCAVCTGFLYFIHFHDFYTPDSSTYVGPAYRLLMGRGFTGENGLPETIRTPGYPLLISTFLASGIGIKGLIVFQHVLRILIILATCVFAFQLNGSRMQAMIGGLVLLFDLPLLEESNFVLTEILFLAVLMVVLWLLWQERARRENSWRRSTLTGLLAGISVLIRPAAILFFIPAGIYLLLLRKRCTLRRLVIFMLDFCCAPVLWATRNFKDTGYFTVTSISGVDMLAYKAAGVLAVSDSGRFDEALGKRQAELRQRACTELQNTYGTDCAQLSDPLKSRYFFKMGIEIIRRHPIAYLKSTVRGVGYILLDGDAPRFSLITRVSPRLAVRILLFYTVPLLAFAFIGLVGFWNENRSFFHLVLWSSAYFILTTAGAEATYRFRVPIAPLYAILVASGVERCFRRLRPFRLEKDASNEAARAD